MQTTPFCTEWNSVQCQPQLGAPWPAFPPSPSIPPPAPQSPQAPIPATPPPTAPPPPPPPQHPPTPPSPPTGRPPISPSPQPDAPLDPGQSLTYRPPPSSPEPQAFIPCPKNPSPFINSASAYVSLSPPQPPSPASQHFSQPPTPLLVTNPPPWRIAAQPPNAPPASGTPNQPIHTSSPHPLPPSSSMPTTLKLTSPPVQTSSLQPPPPSPITSSPMSQPPGPLPTQVRSPSPPTPPSPPSSIPSRDISLTFQTDYARLVDNATLLATFRMAIVFRIAAAAAVAPPSVVLTRLYSGSLSTDLRVYVFLPGTNGSVGLNANAVARLATIVAAPSTIFDAAFLTQFGITGVSAVSLTPAPAAQKLNLTAVIAGSVSGTACLLVCIIVFVIIRRRSRRQRSNKTEVGVVHAASLSTVLFTTHIFNMSFAYPPAPGRTNLQPRLQAGSQKRFLRTMGRGAVGVVKDRSVPLQIIFEDDEELSTVDEELMLMPGAVASERCLERITDLDRLKSRMQTYELGSTPQPAQPQPSNSLTS